MSNYTNLRNPEPEEFTNEGDFLSNLKFTVWDKILYGLIAIITITTWIYSGISFSRLSQRIKVECEDVDVPEVLIITKGSFAEDDPDEVCSANRIWILAFPLVSMLITFMFIKSEAFHNAFLVPDDDDVNSENKVKVYTAYRIFAEFVNLVITLAILIALIVWVQDANGYNREWKVHICWYLCWKHGHFGTIPKNFKAIYK